MDPILVAICCRRGAVYCYKPEREPVCRDCSWDLGDTLPCTRLSAFPTCRDHQGLASAPHPHPLPSLTCPPGASWAWCSNP
jgi:hypothetical protein